MQLHDIYLGLGSNIHPRPNIRCAIDLLRVEMDVLAISSAWETPAVGSPGPDFINAALYVRSELDIARLKRDILRPIENILGRTRTADKNAPRTIDIDVLIYDGIVQEPQIWQHAYLAVPLAELIPDFRAAAGQPSLQEIARRLAEKTKINPCPEVFAPKPPEWP